ncbi:MAG: helix-turn-helix transcriptional regulator [Sulfuritalea sp.]|nr:helix-turn-helix transcriptional regulator [Sulfuritalea sp.]
MSAIGDFLTNDEVIAEVGARLRARRLERNLTVEELAARAGLNRKTVLDLEAGADVRLATVIKVFRALNMLGALDAAIPDTLPGSEAFSNRGQLRQRASGSRHTRG